MLSQKSGISIFTDQTFIQAYPLYHEHFSGIWQTVLGNHNTFGRSGWLLAPCKAFHRHFGTFRRHLPTLWYALVVVTPTCLAAFSYTTALLGNGHRYRGSTEVTVTNSISVKKLATDLDNFGFTHSCQHYRGCPHATRSLLFLCFCFFLDMVSEFLYLQITRVTKKLDFGKFLSWFQYSCNSYFRNVLFSGIPQYVPPPSNCRLPRRITPGTQWSRWTRIQIKPLRF